MYSKLTYKNNWERDEYFIGARRVISLEAVFVDNELYPVVTRPVTVPQDMGENHEARSDHYFIKVRVLGVEREIDLNTVVNDRPTNDPVIAYTFTVADKID